MDHVVVLLRHAEHTHLTAETAERQFEHCVDDRPDQPTLTDRSAGQFNNAAVRMPVVIDRPADQRVVMEDAHRAEVADRVRLLPDQFTDESADRRILQWRRSRPEIARLDHENASPVSNVTSTVTISTSSGMAAPLVT